MCRRLKPAARDYSGLLFLNLDLEVELFGLFSIRQPWNDFYRVLARFIGPDKPGDCHDPDHNLAVLGSLRDVNRGDMLEPVPVKKLSQNCF